MLIQNSEAPGRKSASDVGRRKYAPWISGLAPAFAPSSAALKKYSALAWMPPVSLMPRLRCVASDSSLQTITVVITLSSLSMSGRQPVEP